MNKSKKEMGRPPSQRVARFDSQPNLLASQSTVSALIWIQKVFVADD
jgi:hypothetical protein